MTHRDTLRERVLAMVRQERSRQIYLYGLNEDFEMGFGGSVSDYPWMMPYTADPSGLVEAMFRTDYEKYESEHGKPTWMHLIREEVAELFTTTDRHDTITEAIQVAALCVSLVEHLIAEEEVANEASDQ